MPETVASAAAAPAPGTRPRRPDASGPVAIFCDFDGTFIRQDVGSGLARRHLGAKRGPLQARYASGELDAWQYAELLFTGFDLTERARFEFLDEIELDPGASALLDLCRARDWRFEVLSDGFDSNIDYLRTRFGVDFGFRSNHLEVIDSGWKIAPGARPQACDCGTGLCKREVIRALRRESPGVFVVHVGNGRVSDLCAALEADLAFAKDTLVDALDEAGRSYVRFDHLGEVCDELERQAG